MWNSASKLTYTGAFVVLAAAGLAGCADLQGTAASADTAVAGPVAADDGHAAHGVVAGSPAVDLLTGRSASPDRIDAQIRLQLDGNGRTHVMNMSDVDHLQLAKLTFQPGDAVEWHVHPGPVVVLVDEGVLTVSSARDCVSREYGPDEAYIEQGPGDVLRVSNENGEPTVIYALFFQLPTEGPLTIFDEDPGC